MGTGKEGQERLGRVWRRRCGLKEKQQGTHLGLPSLQA